MANWEILIYFLVVANPFSTGDDHVDLKNEHIYLLWIMLLIPRIREL